MKEEIGDWIKKAESDLDVAKYNFKGNKIDAAAFFCQQATEKALKAVYIKKFDSLLKIHDLVLLSKKVEAPQEIIDLCKVLTSYYIETRYPGLFQKFSEKEVAEALMSSEKVIEWAKKNL